MRATRRRPAADGAVKAVRLAWSHILYPVKTDAPRQAGLRSRALSAHGHGPRRDPGGGLRQGEGRRHRQGEARAGRLWLHLKPLWPEDRPHLPIAEIAEWFASYVYLPKLRDRRRARRRDPRRGRQARSRHSAMPMASTKPRNVIGAWSGRRPRPRSCRRPRCWSAPTSRWSSCGVTSPATGDGGAPKRRPAATNRGIAATTGRQSHPTPTAPSQPPRFYGSVEIDMVRPVKSFDAILNAVVMELQRTQGARSS